MDETRDAIGERLPSALNAQMINGFDEADLSVSAA
jgi:hypothetical protein